jgi:hypothetical protein
MFAYHIDLTTLADGDYQQIPEPERDISEDPRNVIGPRSGHTPHHS